MNPSLKMARRDKELSTSNLVSQAETLLKEKQNDGTVESRRLFIASALFAGGALIGADMAQAVSPANAFEGNLPWQANPVNKRSGVTVFDAEKSGYNLAFVTYLSRFLLNFDADCQRWWFSPRIPRAAKAEEIEKIRVDQFASFSASVEVGLQEFQGQDGPRRLFEELVRRYGAPSVDEGEIDDPTAKSRSRLRKSARRHIALLFGLLEKNQPTTEVTKLLAAVDSGCISSVQLVDGNFSGFELGKEPVVVFPPPQAGDGYKTATGIAILKSTGKLLRLELVDPGSGYSTPPEVTISPPQNGGTAAKAKAKIKKGNVESVELIDAGSGYMNQESIEIQVSRPDLNESQILVLAPILDMAVDRIEITEEGSGYAAEKPVKVYIKSLQDKPEDKGTLLGLIYPKAVASSFTSFRNEIDTKAILDLEEKIDKRYDLKPVRGKTSGKDSGVPPLPFWSGKSSSSELLGLLPAGVGLEYDTTMKRYALAVDTDFMKKYPALVQKSNRPMGVEFGPRGRAPIERDMELGIASYSRFALSGAICASGVHLALTPLDVVKTKVQTNPIKYPGIGSSFKKIFKEDGVSAFYSGWVPTVLGNFINGGVLYALTEVTRRSLSEAAGVDAVALEIPIILTAAGKFCFYFLVSTHEVFLLTFFFLSSFDFILPAVASSVGAIVLCPFEAVRIRSVAQPDYASNAVEVVHKMLREEGVGSLLNAIPIFLVKLIPYAMTKFLIFDLSTEWMYNNFPAAQEELKLSLIVSLVGGILGGSSAAIISNPADCVISELKKAKSDLSPQEALKNLLDRGGIPTLFKGLQLRVVFYSLNASLTFVLYDGVRFLLGIGSDDLKLYLDVLGGVLQSTADS
jgi:solute carrier family 25 phosphate transporter 3